jgi:Tfp pilus assembly protein PilF
MAHHATWLTALVPLAMLLIFWLFKRRAPWLAAAIALFVLAMLPTLGLVPFDFQHYSTVADRYAYLSLVGVAIVVAAILGRSSSKPAWIGAGLIVVALGGLSVRQLTFWGDDAKVLDHALAINPDSLAANTALGFVSTRRGDEALAESYYRRALAIDPDDFRSLFNLGNLMARHGRWDQAVRLYRQAVPINPHDAALHHNLVFALLRKGDLDAAADACRQAISAIPDVAEPHALLAEISAQRGDFRTAFEQFTQAAQLDPDNAMARRGLAQLRQMGFGAGH